MQICEYGCEQEAKYQFKNGKWCCEDNISKCDCIRNKNSKSRKGKLVGKEHPLYGKQHNENTKRKISESNKGKCKGKIPWNKGKTYIELYGYKKAKKIIENQKERTIGKTPWNQFTISYIKEKYPFFSQIEEMRYNPDKPKEKEIQVHCKNHNCKNSKEQGGWFTPTKIQLFERIRQLENENGNGGSYFYCLQECKNECPLFNLKGDPYKNNDLSYTQQEYQQFREYVLERDKHICQYCGETAEHVHHERPQKLEPFYSLDPDLAWSVCSKCHYEKGHKDECSTGRLSTINC